MNAEPTETRLLSVIHGPAFGGAHNQALHLRQPLERRGIRTLVVLPDEAEQAAARMRTAGVEVATMPLQRLRATTNPALQGRFLARLPGDLARLRRLVASRRIDVVQVHGATNPQGAAAARLEGAAVVWQLFDTRAPMAVRRAAMPMVVRLADAMTTWGRELARVHPGAERLGSRLFTVYPPVDGTAFAPDVGQRARAREALEVPEADYLIGAAGVLNPQKGHEYLIRAAELIRQRRDDVHFRVLGGSSPAHAAYERTLRDEVANRGLLGHFRFVNPGTQIPLLMQAFDVFAMTSVPRSEGMPTVILEAMMCEKPVVSTDVGAVSELVEPGLSGIVVQPQRPDLVAAEIVRLIENADLRQRIARAGRERACSEFDLERLADRHASAYRCAIDRRNQRLSGPARSPHPDES